MGFKCGIIGLPNVGKSSLFNALLGAQKVASENYPFCTIEPNVGKVPIKDARLDELGKINSSKQILYAQMEFVDIAGLVKGASKGEGLGNKFLANIREVDAIAHVVRCFEDKNVSHVHNKVDPVYDIEIIENELLLSDLERTISILDKLKVLIKSGKKEYEKDLNLFQLVLKQIESANIKDLKMFAPDQIATINKYGLLSFKPTMYVANLSEENIVEGNDLLNNLEKYSKSKGIQVVNISAKLEAELASIENEVEKEELMLDLKIKDSGLNKFIKEGFKLLNLMTFFTSGERESKAWTIPINTSAPKAASKIHTDFEKGFIAAEVISYSSLITAGGEKNAKNKGLIRTEGKDYIVQDGDVVLFRFNV